MVTKMSRQNPDADPELIGLQDPPGQGTEDPVPKEIFTDPRHWYTCKDKVLTRSSVAVACGS
jgi:hypothetical protein